MFYFLVGAIRCNSGHLGTAAGIGQAKGALKLSKIGAGKQCKKPA
jgi:hypothetical protein